MPAHAPTLLDLTRYAVARSLFAPTTLPRAIAKLGFVQADPIRAPARAQDLTLRHRVRDYRAGDLERRYPRLAIDEDFFVNYGFLPRATHALMHPREARTAWTPARWAQAHAVLEFVRERGSVHPREVDAAFQHGKTKNWFGGSSNASTQLLDGMHYRGLVRIARREGGVRVYAARPGHDAAIDPATSAPARPPIDPAAAMDTLVSVVVNKYAPLPEASLSQLVMHLRAAAPQWTALRQPALARAKARLSSARIDGRMWYWPAGENPRSRRFALDDELRLLAPFDPVVWDRRRFEAFWGWPYRFEAYVPAPKRLRGYYALPMLWRGQVLGWANVSARAGAPVVQTGFADGARPPRAEMAAFRQALRAETERLAAFLTPAEA